VKKSTKIAPIDTQLDFKQASRNPTIVFSVGFEYAEPQTAARVANELMTRILNEDIRDRTSRASDTTKFLAREVQRLQADSDALDAKIAQLKLAQIKAAQEKAVGKPDLLGQLKVELAQKSALYSEKHPILQGLKRQIETMEREVASSAKNQSPAATDDAVVTANSETLKAQQETLQKNLDAASTKLAAARIGENLERNQQSEKLEIIEQPTAPQTPVRPNRPKVAGLALLFAAAVGAGLAFIAEIADKSIRRSSDLFGVIDERLIVSIPYITTSAELKRRKDRLRVAMTIFGATVVAAAIAAYLMLPIDLMIAKAQLGLFR
jgi:uncharacterized protein involved in exopolysaccharide biosynthesis